MGAPGGRRPTQGGNGGSPRAFLGRLARFALIFAGFALASRGLNQLLLPFHLPEWSGEVRVLLAGDSHVVNGLVPEVVPGSVNIGQSAEPLSVTHAKLEWILAHEPGVEVVVLGLAPHNLARYQDLNLRDGPILEMLVRRYHGLLQWSEIGARDVDWVPVVAGTFRYLWLPNPHLLGDGLSRSLGRGERTHEYLGGFLPHDTTGALDQAALDRLLHQHFARGPEGGVVSDAETAWLHRVVQAAREAGIRLVLLSTPVHRSYRNAVPDELRAHFEAEVARAVTNGHVEFWDYEAGADTPGELWDLNHLSRRGAERISGLIAARLAEGR